MQYSEIVNDIYTLTNRPDLVAETALAIRKATLKMHSLDYFTQDRVSNIITITPAMQASILDNRYAIDLSPAGGNTTRYRAISFIREYNNPLTGQEIQFLKLEPDSIFNEYNLERQNYYYIAGSSAQLRSNKVLTQVTLAYYQYPDVNSTTYTSWIAAQFPYAIIEEAARAIFKMIGKDEEAQTYQEATAENIAMLQEIGVTNQGY
jgi:hypothetical protein